MPKAPNGGSQPTLCGESPLSDTRLNHTRPRFDSKRGPWEGHLGSAGREDRDHRH